ncbi:DNA primase [Clostridium sp. VAP52]|uniref:DNA primase n=1 Tax=Clostridium sp. VAP52 TaxID=2949977 RepID=UPI00207ACAD9|nr:DNA primase [Clostridium sp. VAP52]
MHNNSTATAIKKESLSVTIYGSDGDIRGDIITLIMDIKFLVFPKAIKYIHKILGLKYYGINTKSKDTEKVDILRVFKKALKKYKDYYDEELKILSEDITKEYEQIPYIEWVKEGILPRTQQIFGIGYSSKSNRVVIPHRYWCGNENDYVGLIGRTLVKNYDMFDIPKYFPLHKYHKSKNLYGLQENYKGIQEAGYVTVFEAEKSTLKRHSKKDYTGVSLFGHELSLEQAKILISLNVDIIIALDKDISLNFVRSICEMFYGIRNTYYIYDEYGLLNEKESPADKHEKIYKVLFNRRVKYDEKEHNEYLKYKGEN